MVAMSSDGITDAAAKPINVARRSVTVEVLLPALALLNKVFHLVLPQPPIAEFRGERERKLPRQPFTVSAGYTSRNASRHISRHKCAVRVSNVHDKRSAGGQI